MTILHVMCGIPGCGKSTAAESLRLGFHALVVCPDSIRESITGDINDQSENAAVFHAAHSLTRYGLEQGRNVVFDATNVNHARRADLVDYAHSTGAEAHLHLFNTLLATAKLRNLSRSRTVPEEVLDRMHGELVDSIPLIPSEGWDQVHYYE